METMEPFESMKEVENGSPEKNATLIYLTVILQYREIFYLIVGIPLVLCSTFVGKSLQVYLVLEKSFNFKPTIFKFLHDDCYIIVWTSINFNSRIPVFRPVFAESSTATSRTQNIINTSWIYLEIYCNRKDQNFCNTSNWPNLELGTNPGRSNSGGTGLAASASSQPNSDVSRSSGLIGWSVGQMTALKNIHKLPVLGTQELPWHQLIRSWSLPIPHHISFLQTRV